MREYMTVRLHNDTKEIVDRLILEKEHYIRDNQKEFEERIYSVIKDMPELKGVSFNYTFKSSIGSIFEEAIDTVYESFNLNRNYIYNIVEEFKKDKDSSQFTPRLFIDEDTIEKLKFIELEIYRDLHIRNIGVILHAIIVTYTELR